MKKISLILVTLSFILFFACDANTYSDIEQPVANATPTPTPTPSPTPTPTPTPTPSVTYTNDIQPIIATNCTSCHRSGFQSPSLTTYTQVKNATSSGSLICSIQAQGCKTMPPTGKMSQANINLILLWKTQGYIQ